jgi:hypothetical protein
MENQYIINELEKDRDKYKVASEVYHMLLTAWGRALGFKGEDWRIISDMEHIGISSPKEKEWSTEKEIMFKWLVNLTKRDNESKENAEWFVKDVIKGIINRRKLKKGSK